MRSVLGKELLSCWIVTVAGLAIALDKRCSGMPAKKTLSVDVSNQRWRDVEMTYSTLGTKNTPTNDVVNFVERALKRLANKQYRNKATSAQVLKSLKNVRTRKFVSGTYNNVKRWQHVTSSLKYGMSLWRERAETLQGDQILVLLAYWIPGTQVSEKAVSIVKGITKCMEEDEDITVVSGQLQEDDSVKVAVYVNQAHTSLADVDLKNGEISFLDGANESVIFRSVTPVRNLNLSLEPVLEMLKTAYQMRQGELQISFEGVTAKYVEKSGGDTEVIGLFHDVMHFVFQVMMYASMKDVRSPFRVLPPTTLLFQGKTFELEIKEYDGYQKEGKSG